MSNGLEKIEKFAFRNCRKMDNVVIPNTVNTIDGNAFITCDNLKNITIPSSVTKIGDGAFAYCDKLTINCEKGSYAEQYAKKNGIAVKYVNEGPTTPTKPENKPETKPETKPEVKPADTSTVIQPVKDTKRSDAASYVVSKTKKTVEYKKVKTKSNTAKVPDTIKVKGKKYKVTSIAKGAFKNNKKIQTVVVGKNVTTIGNDAFSGAKKVKSITLNGNNIKKVGKNAFKGVKKNCKITIQAKNKKQYNKIVKMIKKSGAKNVKYRYKKKK